MSVNHGAGDVEGLLRLALAPIEPPEHLAVQLEQTLEALTAAAAEDLDSWELVALHDPRTWLKPATAVAVGTTAAAALALVQLRRRRGRRHDGDADPVRFAADAARTIADEISRRTRR
ncbi:unannotated protein [freshwater metagenome]|uniref:Unannotated protein n=1 Tax=freshwater metagenome TaxID=449393 RepID=A0A6J7J129_9ZZZZ|nr:hypothetical protein [Actinomycetota bacterium]